ncbi:MAG: TIGR03032 family protein [Oculatellaceae cyanobacterium Prado106]|nr:TIGR03032 family protein [Oculatellaceae cyanobacterium Prado106]
MPQTIQTAADILPPKQILGSPQVIDWLKTAQISLACTTYQTSRLFLLGVNPSGHLAGFERLFDRAMGLYATADRLYLSTKYQIWQLDNVLEPGQHYNGHDRLYIPRIGRTTGDLDIHDVVAIPTESGQEQIIFVSTTLNCLATVSDRHSCQPFWKPPFISKIINEDRCHLNGLAVVDHQPRYVTMVSQSDIVDGWRDRRDNGGLVMDILSNEIITTGLSMPHSPRWYRDRLWLLNSGRGEFGFVDQTTGQFEPVAFCPGYLRGLAFWQDWAIVGLSKSRKDDHTFGGLALDERLRERGVEAQCGLMMINLVTGKVDHWLWIEGGAVTELYDVQVLPGVNHPMALGFQTEEIAQLITLEPFSTQPFPQHQLVQDSPVQTSLTPSESPANRIDSEPITQSASSQIPAQQGDPSLNAVNSEAIALFEQSKLHKQQENWNAAEQCLRQAIQLQPSHWGACNNLATLLQQQGDLTAAESLYEQALQYKPDFAEAIANRASIWQLQGELERAKPEFLRALQLKPNYVPAHLNLAHLYQQQGRLGGALDHFQQVVKLDPSRTEAWFQMGQILEYQDQTEAALTVYQQALVTDPNAKYIHAYINLIQLRQCNWQDYEHRMQTLLNTLIQSLTDENAHGFNPFMASLLNVPLSLHREIAQVQAQRVLSNGSVQPLPPRLLRCDRPSTPLRIGYLSPDFRDHAVGRLIYQIFQHHDRHQFRIYAYTTVDTQDAITEQIQKGCDQFTNLGLMTTQQAAQQIRDDEIDILIDLAGYTIGNGAAILALQPAPIQAQFLGYPDTMGAPFVQYAIADDWLITPEIAATYTEDIIRLPHAFVGSSLAIAEGTWTKSEFGLPESGFVFGCFNTHHKINPEVFDAWMQILHSVPESVLWLLGGTEITQSNLRHEAMQRGVDGDRLFFSQKVSYAEYLAKYQFVDLFLDTFIYSAGSTAIAALWGGTPVLTRPGVTNASRMGASICAAAQLEELICPTTEAYVQKAIALANQPEELVVLRSRLQQRPLPLFDVPGFTRSLEAAFMQMTAAYGREFSLQKTPT